MKRSTEIGSNSPNSTQAPTPLLDQSVKEHSASAAKKSHYTDFPFRVNPSFSLSSAAPDHSSPPAPEELSIIPEPTQPVKRSSLI
ncbi:hypothetical protein, partial [Brevundimonas sp.]|uniref:hypothetical protein n=1 Tax=Brevundimonas sp. TaxID=1871086 RepID=UPI002D311157